MAGVRAELRYAGTAVTTDILPAVFNLDPTAQTILVGRYMGPEVEGDRVTDGLALDAPEQLGMMSVFHARLDHVPACQRKDGSLEPSYWKLTDTDSMNGILYNGVRVRESRLSGKKC